MKKILFFTYASLKKEFGAAKVVIELSEEMKHLGWECTLVCPSDLVAPGEEIPTGKDISNKLKRYLELYANRYDVVDYDHAYLPFSRTEFSLKPIFVARSVLLTHHLETISIPSGKSIKSRVGAVLKRRTRQQQYREWICQAQKTVEEADIINVSNEDDKQELIKRGLPFSKIIVLPFGISRTRRPSFDTIPSDVPEKPIVAFVGTFDYRKGAKEFPAIVGSIAKKLPTARFRFLGTSGMFQTAEEVLAQFPRSIRPLIEVIPKFRAEELPGLLSACTVGVFPSYVEGFGFGVLEMMAASIPVVAYDAPGPPMMLSSEYLVECGDAGAMSTKIISLLNDPIGLRRARVLAKQKSQEFDWERIAGLTSETYLTFLNNRNPNRSK